MFAYPWQPNQRNLIKFVLSDSDGNEVGGLATGSYVISLCKGTGTFSVATGDRGELGGGWYYYYGLAADADTRGSVALTVTGSSIVQQNLEYVVGDRVSGGVGWPYYLTSSVTGDPIPGARIRIATDTDGTNVVWAGYTDAFGVARDINGNLPWIDPGTYQVFRYHPGHVFVNPDEETVTA